MDFKEILTASMILFAIIDIIGATPIVISLRKKVGKIESEKATLVSMIIMIGFLFLGEEILNLIGIDINSFAVAGSISEHNIDNMVKLGVNFFDLSSSLESKLGQKDHLKIRGFMNKINKINEHRKN